MKIILILICAVSLGYCTYNVEPKTYEPTKSVSIILDIPDTTVDKSELVYDRNNSLWKLNDQIFSGYAVSYYQDKELKERFGILDGKKQNQEIHWFPDGHYKRVSNYHKGKLHGAKKSWDHDEPHRLMSQLSYVTGKLHGSQTKWYPSGKVFKKMNYTMGTEEGIQQAFRENGDLYANYEAKDGRIFGLKKTALCFGIEDEQIQYQY